MGGIKEKSAGALAKLGKYKYALLVLLLGVVLLLLPSGGKAAKAETPAAQAPAQQEMAEDAAVLQAQLGKLLSRIQGAGEVEVILTLRTGTQYVYQTDVTQEERGGEDDPQSSVTPRDRPGGQRQRTAAGRRDPDDLSDVPGRGRHQSGGGSAPGQAGSCLRRLQSDGAERG